jgi:hypothetical protein
MNTTFSYLCLHVKSVLIHGVLNTPRNVKIVNNIESMENMKHIETSKEFSIFERIEWEERRLVWE